MKKGSFTKTSLICVVICFLLLTSLTPMQAISQQTQPETTQDHKITNQPLYLKWQTFDPLQKQPNLIQSFSVNEQQTELFIVQFSTPQIYDWQKDAIEQNGGKLLAYLPEGAFITQIDQAVLPDIKDLEFIRWVGPYHPLYKLGSGILETSGLIEILIDVFDEKDLPLVSQKIHAIGGIITDIPHPSLLQVKTSANRIDNIAFLNEVAWIELTQENTLMMNNVRHNDVSGANFLHSNGYDGTGIVGGVCEEGYDRDHYEYDSRILAEDGFVYDNVDHGTCTFGIIFAEGQYSTAKGMLPNAEGVFTSWGVGQYTRIRHLWQNWGGVFMSQSYGHASSTYDGKYTSYSRNNDEAIYDYDHVTSLWAGGNNAGSEISDYGVAKNVICVGGMDHYNNNNLGDDRHADANVGPAEDGRIKPDLCAEYDSVYCTDVLGSSGYWGNDYYPYFGGTSAATPIVAGATGLVYDMYEANHFGNNPTHNLPKAATVKALLINHAHQYNLGSQADRYEQGWGHPDVQAIYDSPDDIISNEEYSLNTGGSQSWFVSHKVGQPLKITLVWTDYPGTTSSSKHLINDLSLKVTDPNSNVWWGNEGLINSHWSSQGGSEDHTNNVENVFIQSPINGQYTVEVIGNNVPNGPQDFSLIISGAASGNQRPYTPSNPDPAHNAERVDINTDLAWDSGDPDGDTVTYDVYFGTTNPPPLDGSFSEPGTTTRLTYTLPTLDQYTQYYWQVVATDNGDPEQTATGPVWRFQTDDISNPEWRNQQQQHNTIPEGGTNDLSAEGRDNIMVDYAYLSTNENGFWEDYLDIGWWNRGWNFSKEMVIDHTLVAEELDSFPVLVSITDAELVGDTQPNGEDFVFTDESNWTVFPHEIEYYNSATGELVAWVNVPSISASEDTRFYMYYGNSTCPPQWDKTATWNGRYVLVHHLSGSTWTSLDDSTNNSYDITSIGGSPSYNQNGKTGQCVGFDGSSYLQAADFRFGDDPFTVSAWVLPDNLYYDEYVVSGNNQGHADVGNPCLMIEEYYDYYHRSKILSAGGTPYESEWVSDGSDVWTYMVGRAEPVAETIDLFINGALQDSSSSSSTIKKAEDGINIGASASLNDRFDGRIDELRVAELPLTDGWIETEYNSMNDPSSFMAVGSEVRVSGGEKHGSPIQLDSDPWVWELAMFPWENDEITTGTTVEWTVTYVDVVGNKITTDIMSFDITEGSPTFTLEGNCFYDDAKTQPVNNLDVVIENLDTGSSWPATTTNNHYELELDPDTDVSAGDTLRYFATDDGHYINVTDRVVTQSDIDSGGITLDLILKEYYTDLTDFPYYPTEDHSSAGRTMEEMTGPACLEMATDYMHWNTTTDPGTTAPRYTQNNLGDQLWIYNEARSLQTNTDHSFVSARGMQQYLQNYMPQPYGDYGYNFNIKYTGCPWNENWTQDSILGAICIWTDYSTSYALDYDSENKQTVADPYGEDDKPLKPGHKPHVPAFIPAFGDYGRWMAIRGLHTDTEPWVFEHPHGAAMDEIEADSQANALNVYGFWVNDPLTTGIGENTYKTGDEFKNTYFTPLAQTGDPYDGEYVAVVEPPKEYTTLQATPEMNTVSWPEPLKTTRSDSTNLGLRSYAQIIKAATTAIQKIITLNDEINMIYKHSHPTLPLYIHSNQNTDEEYYLIKFITSQSSWRPRDSILTHNTSLVVLVDADTGQFKELSWTEQPVDYLKIDIPKAETRLISYLKQKGYQHINPILFDYRYINRSQSPFYPDIEAQTPYGTYYITQQGTIES